MEPRVRTLLHAHRETLVPEGERGMCEDENIDKMFHSLCSSLFLFIVTGVSAEITF